MDECAQAEVGVAPTVLEAENAPPATESEPREEGALPSILPNPVKVDAFRRLKALERRGKTVGTHLDELRSLLTVLFELMPD